MFYVYVLRSLADKKLYIGSTRDLKRRLAEHNSGSSKSTKPRRPFELLYYEAYKAEADARSREKRLKLFGKAREGLMRRLSASLKSQ